MELLPDSVIEERLVETFPNTRLRELARAFGLIQREGGELKADALFWSLAIGVNAPEYVLARDRRQRTVAFSC
jgi:hypothetical protein